MIAVRSWFERRAAMLRRRLPLVLLFTAGILPAAWAADVQSRLFTYQGRLTQSGEPAIGAFNLQFTLFDAPVGGAALASVVHTNVVLDHGVFTVSLDFGASLAELAGAEAWLEISTQAAASTTGPQVLEPRQLITPAPFAWFAPYATEAGSAQTAHATGPGAVTSDGLVEHAVGPEKIAPGTVVRSINQLTDSVRLLAGENVEVDTTPEGLRISATPSAAEQPVSSML